MPLKWHNVGCSSNTKQILILADYTANRVLVAVSQLSGSVRHIQPSAGLGAECQVGQLFDCKYGRHGYIR